MNQPTRPVRSLTFWFTNLRSIALIACVTGVLSLPIPMWNAAQTTIAATSQTNDFWRLAGTLLLVLVTLFTAIFPIFYFALYRNEAVLYFPKRLRLLALIAAAIFSVIVLTTLPAYVKSLTDYLARLVAFDWSIGGSSVLAIVRDRRTINQLSTLLGQISNIATILLLIGIFCHAGEALESDVPVYRLLRVMTKIAFFTWRIVLAVTLLRFAALPFVYIQLRNYALQLGRTPPPFRDILAIRESLLQVCLFAAPYIVYKSLRERTPKPTKVQSGPERSESDG